MKVTIILVLLHALTLVSLGFALLTIDNCQKYNVGTRGGFNFYPRRKAGGSFESVLIVGDVNEVLAGRVNHITNKTSWSAQGLVGFGAGAIGPTMDGLGEAFIANGYVFVRDTNNGTANYFKTITDTQFRSPFAMFVPRGLKPYGTATFTPSSGASFSYGEQRRKGAHAQRGIATNISMIDLYTQIYKEMNGAPFCFHGLTEFKQMDAIAISKAPIYNEPLFGDTMDQYYTQPIFQIPNAYGLVFGCVANFSTVTDAELYTKLSRALYVNPLDDNSKTALQVHSHVLTLDPCVTNLNQIHPTTAIDVFHLLSNATVNKIIARVFRIDSSADLVDITPLV
jgi:hypothetical protein